MTPFGWLPAGLASQLADYLTPSRRDVADTLDAPVDATSYWLHRLDRPGCSYHYAQQLDAHLPARRQRSL